MLHLHLSVNEKLFYLVLEPDLQKSTRFVVWPCVLREPGWSRAWTARKGWEPNCPVRDQKTFEHLRGESLPGRGGKWERRDARDKTSNGIILGLISLYCIDFVPALHSGIAPWCCLPAGQPWTISCQNFQPQGLWEERREQGMVLEEQQQRAGASCL